VSLGTTPQGQGHETTAAQVAADVLGVTPADVRVETGFDKRRNAYVASSGTYASQFAVTGLGAVLGATRKLRGEIVQIASFALDASEDEIELVAGAARVKGDPSRELPFIGIANLAFANIASLPDELAESISLVCRYVYRAPFTVPDPETKRGNLTLTYATQVHACVVEIDKETGEVAILDYAAIDDCGVRINPQIVEGQVHGAIAHGIGAALHEVMANDESGRHLTPNFFDYHAANALDVPRIKTDYIESPSPFTPNGAKGMGEGAGGPLHAIGNAIQDALGPSDRVVSQSFHSAEDVWRLLRSGAEGSPRGVRVVR
jgi:CO/xanthine dehydrogenase Mo-binding subunit